MTTRAWVIVKLDIDKEPVEAYLAQLLWLPSHAQLGEEVVGMSPQMILMMRCLLKPQLTELLSLQTVDMYLFEGTCIDPSEYKN